MLLKSFRLALFIVLVCLLELLSTRSFAQSFKAGLILGANTSQITGDALRGFDRISPNLGLFVNREFGKKFSMQLEMQYLGKGSRKNMGAKDSIPTFYVLRLNYIEVPLLLSYAIKPKILLVAGPSIGVLISYKEADLYGDLKGQYSPKEQFKRIDYSGSFGGSWLINDSWTLNVLASNSIVPVRNYDGQISERLLHGQMNKSIMIRLYYKF